MIPPVDPTVLEENPDFADVYRKLTEDLLNPDASTRNDAEAEKREHVRLELREYRINEVKRRLLRRALDSAAAEHAPATTTTTTSKSESSKPRSSNLPTRRQRTNSSKGHTRQQSTGAEETTSPELIQLLTLLPPLLNHSSTLPESSLSLILNNPPLSNLPSHLPELASLLSTTLTRSATTTTRAMHPRTNASYLHRTIPMMPQTATQTLAVIASRESTLRAARLAATSALAITYLSPHSQLQGFLLACLERQHGDLAARTVGVADRISLSGKAWREASLAALWCVAGDAYPPSARTALENYRVHLRTAEMRVVDGIKLREAELKEYGVDDCSPAAIASKDGGADDDDDGEGRDPERRKKEKTLREMARVCREMQTRMKEVKGDLQRLGR